MKYTYILIAFLIPALGTTSCNNKANVPTKSEKTEKFPTEVATEVFEKSEITKEGAPELNDEHDDCHGVRKTIQNLIDQKGNIMNVGGRFVIGIDEGNRRYNPCEIDDKLKVEGLKVQFSGDVLEIFMGERLIATPIRLKYIREVE